MTQPERNFAQLERDLRTLRHTVEALRLAGVDILSAEITTLGESPVIHVVDHPTVRALDGRYVRARVAGEDIHAAPYLGCQLTWLTASPTAGLVPINFSRTTERTASHG